MNFSIESMSIKSRLNAKQFFQTTGREASLLLVCFLGFLWAILINHLQAEWTVNPQYGYGWAVPFLCAFMVWKKFDPESRIPNPESRISQSPGFICYFLLVFFALLYAPTHLIEVASPEWRLVSWALAIEVVGLTLLLIYFFGGSSWLKRLAFPIAYFLVAVPWPTVVEGPLIQGLTRADAGASVELLGWLGIPAMPHGNVIEVATGQVGIDEACSGIRSFQATLMISLFLGELYALNYTRRAGLVLGGFAMSFGFNVARMTVLVWVAAHDGIAAIAQWHDPAGITILLACFFALWGLGIFLARKRKIISPVATNQSTPNFAPPQRRMVRLLVALVCWFAVVEISVEAWYRWHERQLPSAAQWTMSWPTNNPTFKDAPLSDRARQLLRYDEGRSVAWAADGIEWQAVFLRWNPGRIALHLAQNHTPEVCMTAAGHTLTTVSERVWFAAGNLRLPFIVYAVTDTPSPVYVFYCLWDDRARSEGRGTRMWTYGNRLAPALQGLRNPGQRSLEIALAGNLDEAQAEAAFQNQLQTIIQSEPGNLPAGGLK
jgi:exosortase